MSSYSQRVLRNQRRYRRRRGEWVTFNGVRYKALVESVSGAQAGEQAVSHGTYGVYVASSDPHVFDFDPLDFHPNTAVVAPQEGDEFTRNNLLYVVTNRKFENEDTDTTGLLCECLRKIWAVPP